MTQRNNSAKNRLNQPKQQCLSKRLASKLPAQSLCWLSSLTMLGSGGLVFAQTESAVDNIVPTIENSHSAPANPVPRSTAEQDPSPSTPKSSSSQAQPDFSQRRSRLRQRLSRSKSSNPVAAIRRSRQQEEDSPAKVVIRSRRSRPRLEVSVPTTTARKLRNRLRTARRIAPAITQEENSQLEVSQSRTSVVRDEKPQREVSRQSYSSDSSGNSSSKDYNNAYIDPTDYTVGATQKYEAPDSVVITARSSKKVANSYTRLPRIRKQSPSWLRRSQTATLATVPPIPSKASGVNSRLSSRRSVTSPVESNSVVRHTHSVSSPVESNSVVRHIPRIVKSVATNPFVRHTPRIASADVPQRPYRRNRFIPNDFTPTTTVSSVPIAPTGDVLPAPVTAENIAPRPSTVAYDIPLESTLPQIANENVYAGSVAYNGTGLIFPLSMPAPITSLFGWRTHPITGDRRFHSGTDIGAAMGTPVLAAYSGQVEMADWVGGYGLTVVLNHNSAQQTLYGHMSEIFVQPGQTVEQGTVIGRVGSTGNSTGPHLHFEVRQLTASGWVATDPGAQLESAVGQLVQALQTAQNNQQPGS